MSQRRLRVSSPAAAVAGITLTMAAVPAFAQQEDRLDEIVVTGFRASLNQALAAKREETAIVDVIYAEDIADFPDINLAESLQRISGVAIDRDGGEGRSITVRGLSGEFTRIRLNGLETLATSGSKDSAGGANRGRGFDFQQFASELFSSATVRKAQTASVEEGSLGATVDLATGRPFDTEPRTFAASLVQGWNDLSRSSDPRATLLLSDQWLEGSLGALVSIAYSERSLFEETAQSGRWENPSVALNSAGCFQSPGPCDAQNGLYSAVNSAWHARIPRYGRLTYESERLGVTASIQARPNASGVITLDSLWARLDGSRDEQYLGVFSLGHRRGGVDQTDVRDFRIDGQNQLVSATFDDVDVRSESRYDEFTNDFHQVSATWDQDFGERLTVRGLVGVSRSVQDNPIQTTISIDRMDHDGYAYDFSNSQQLFDARYGFDVLDPNNWAYVSSNAQGDPSFLRMRPNRTENAFETLAIDVVWRPNDSLNVVAGALFKDYTFETVEKRRFQVNRVQDGAVPLPAGVTLASVTSVLGDFGRGMNLPANVPTSWLAPDARRIAALLDIYCNCVNAYGDFRVSAENQTGANRGVSERHEGLYVQADLSTEVFGRPLRGNFGVRHVTTDSVASGFVGLTYVSVPNRYDDTLPALNLVLEPFEDVLIRFGAAKVMSRPQLAFMTPGGNINNTARNLTIGNPLIEPVRATTLDLALEWYPSDGALASVSLFRKDLSSYIQTSAQTMPFSATGLPDLLLGFGNTADTPFLVTQLVNTDGGTLEGVEISLQGRFAALPSPLDRLGGIVNYTHVASEVTYITDAGANPPATVRLPLVNLSPNAWNATLYYEDERLSARISASYRDGYIALVPGGNGNDARGKDETFNLDFSASYELTLSLTATLEAINLTDDFESRWVSSERRNSEEYSHTGRQVFVGLRYRY